jgi:TetR/AcrR family transcriptional regulator, transcriptional repressor for nem operon
MLPAVLSFVGDAPGLRFCSRSARRIDISRSARRIDILWQLLHNVNELSGSASVAGYHGGTMARPITFDEGAALDAAIECFWHHGYRASSVRDLASSMEICGTSLYNSFGNKRALFLKALERYLDRSVRARMRRVQDAHPPKHAVKAFFAEVIERSLEDRARRGCLLINSALEVAPHDKKLGVEIGKRLEEVEAFFRELIIAGQTDGTIPKHVDAPNVARLLLGVLLGIRVLARSRPERRLLEGMALPALSLLDETA